MSVSDAAIQVSFPNEDLFPKRGDAITCTVGGKSRIIRGNAGEAAVITINGDPADLYTQIGSGDIIKVVPSTTGDAAHLDLGDLPEMSSPIRITINGKTFDLPRTADVNGKLESAFYSVKDGDDITVRNYYTVEQLVNFMDVEISFDSVIYVNNVSVDPDEQVYENFTVDFMIIEPDFGDKEEDKKEEEEIPAEEETPAEKEAPVEEETPAE